MMIAGFFASDITYNNIVKCYVEKFFTDDCKVLHQIDEPEEGEIPKRSDICKDHQM